MEFGAESGWKDVQVLAGTCQPLEAALTTGTRTRDRQFNNQDLEQFQSFIFQTFYVFVFHTPRPDNPQSVMLSTTTTTANNNNNNNNNNNDKHNTIITMIQKLLSGSERLFKGDSNKEDKAVH